MNSVDARPARPEHPLVFTPFAVRSTGLVGSQVRLHVGTHVLAGSPIQLSRERAVFATVLKPAEARLFRRYRGRPCGVRMAFRSYGHGMREVLLRATLERLEVVRNRRFTCLVTFSLRECPSDLAMIMERCIERLASLQELYESLAGHHIGLVGGYDAGEGLSALAELTAGHERSAVRVRSVAVDGLRIDLPGSWRLEPGASCVVALHGSNRRICVNAVVSSINSLRLDGSRQAVLHAGFIPELVDAVNGLVPNGSSAGLRTPA